YPDRAGWYARQWFAVRVDQCCTRVLRPPQPAAARREACTGRRVGTRGIRVVREDARSAVRRPDQGTPVLARRGELHRKRGPRRVLVVAEPECRGRRGDRATCDRTCRSTHESGETSRPQENYPGACPARQAGRLRIQR